MKIYLIGYMASGKSTVGRELARLMGYGYVDIDEYIEKQQRETIAEIFQERGEDFFRYIEKEALHEVAMLHSNCVVATGGGTSCFYSNINFMNCDGITVYLRLEVATLVSRLVDDKAQRPLIAMNDSDNLSDYILNALDIRRKFYEKSKIILDVDTFTPVEIAEIIENIVVHHK